MSLPILVCCGASASGKDSLGNYLADCHNAVSIGLADPLKLMARDFFGFSDDQLFGPSERRNEQDERFRAGVFAGARMRALQDGCTERQEWWVSKLFQGNDKAQDNLGKFFDDCCFRICNGGGLSPRYVLQALGTDFARSLDKAVWSRFAIKTALKALGGGYTYTRAGGMVKSDNANYKMVVIPDVRFLSELVEFKAVGSTAIKIERDILTDIETSGIAGHDSEKMGTIPLHFFDRVLINDGSLADLYYFADILAEKMLKSPFTYRTKGLAE